MQDWARENLDSNAPQLWGAVAIKTAVDLGSALTATLVLAPVVAIFLFASDPLDLTLLVGQLTVHNPLTNVLAAVGFLALAIYWREYRCRFGSD